MDIVNFNEAEIARPEDVTAIGENARAAMDAVQEGALGWPAHWARITVAQSTSDIVTVSPGEYHNGDKVFYGKETISLNLQTYKPVIASDERWIALILRGSAETLNATRSVETSEEPLTESIPVNQSLPKTLARRMSVVVQLGEIAPPPTLRPSVNENDCCIAFVRLKTTGVQEIVANDADRVKTVAEIEGRLSGVEVRVDALYTRTEAIETNLANLGAAVKAAPSRALVAQLANDVSRTRQRLQFPDAARNYYFDDGLIRAAFWDLQHASSIARIFEGVRYAYAQVRDTQLALANPANADVTVFDNRIVLPKYTEVVRMESPPGSGRQDISNTIHTVTTATQHTVSHESIRYGATVEVCENKSGWEAVGGAKAGEIFAVNGQEFVSGGLSDDPWNNNPASENHQSFYATGIIRDYYTSTYTTYHTEEFGLSGAIYGQTFLSSQIMVCTSIDLYFTRVGSAGDITLCICKLNPAGAPDYDSVIAKMVKPQAELSEGWVNFKVPPTLFEPGKRYAWFVVTGGNHQLAMNSGNTFAGGSKFVCTDGVWSQGSTTEDFSFRINGAKFEKNRTVVEMQAAILTDGFSELQMVFQGWEPPGTQRSWEIQPFGSEDWIPFDARPDNPLANLPAQAGLRMIMQGTEDIAPMIILDTNARIITGRMRNDLRAVSQVLDFGFSTETVEFIVNVDAFDIGHHTFTPRLRIGSSVYDAESVSATIDPTKPSRTTYKAVFDFEGAPIASARAQLESTTDTVVKVPFVQDIQINAF